MSSQPNTAPDILGRGLEAVVGWLKQNQLKLNPVKRRSVPGLAGCRVRVATPTLDTTASLQESADMMLYNITVPMLWQGV